LNGVSDEAGETDPCLVIIGLAKIGNNSAHPVREIPVGRAGEANLLIPIPDIAAGVRGSSGGSGAGRLRRDDAGAFQQDIAIIAAGAV
jgi:hypothetical protein